MYKFPPGYTGQRKNADKVYPDDKNFNWFTRTGP